MKNYSIKWDSTKIIKFFILVAQVVFLFFKQMDDLIVPFALVWYVVSIVFTRGFRLKKLFIPFYLIIIYSIILLTVYLFGGKQSIKILVNCITTFVIIHASIISSTYLYNKGYSEFLILSIIVIGVINSLVNIYSWISTTGGVIARYNFSSVITGSVSANVGLSAIAALLVLSSQKIKGTIKWIFFTLCASNLIIILTRKTQVTFIIYLLAYVYCLNYHEKRLSKSMIRLLLLVIVALTLFVVFHSTFETIFKTFNNMFDSTRADQIQRGLASKDAFEMFRESHMFGVGFGNFAMNTKYTYLASPHGGFYCVLAELGIPGVVLVCVFIIELLSLCIWAIKYGNCKEAYAVAIVLGMTGLMFYIANLNYLPPPNERAYYLDCCICWILIGYLNGMRESAVSSAYCKQV